MLNLMSSRGPRALLALLIAGLVLTTSGCSLFKKKGPVSKAPVAMETPAPVSEIPTVTPQDHPPIGEPTEFPEGSGVSDVHFDYDKANIRPDQLAVLDKNLDYFKSNSQVKIMIVGHADERGTEEYNYALGQRRAAAVQDYLLKGGIAADRLLTLSKGKSEPLELGHTNAAWSKNRRDHFMKVQTQQ